MPESKHTPTPWTMDEVRTQVGRAFRIGSGEMLRAGKGCCIIYADFRAPGQDSERHANAAFIVEACNSHEASKAIIAELVKDMREIAHGDSGVDTIPSLEDAFGRVLKIARAAVAKASAYSEGE